MYTCQPLDSDNVDNEKASTSLRSRSPSPPRTTPVRQRARKGRNGSALGGSILQPSTSPGSLEAKARYFTPAAYPGALYRTSTGTGVLAGQEPNVDSVSSERYYTAAWNTPIEHLHHNTQRAESLEEQEQDILRQDTRPLNFLFGDSDIGSPLSPTVARQLRSAQRTPVAGNLFGERLDFLSEARTGSQADYTPSRQATSSTAMLASRWASPEKKPRKPESMILASRWAPHPEDAASDQTSELQRDEAAKTEEVEMSSEKPSATPTELEKPRVPRLRKRVPWNGRQCLIYLPLGPPEQFGGCRPMSEDEMEERMRRWEEAGFDTAGFDHAPDEKDTSNRSQQDGLHYSETQHLFSPDAVAHHRVRLPNLQAWQDYVEHLREQKLRALGVGTIDQSPSTGNEQAMQQAMRTSSPSFSPVMTGPFSFMTSSRSTPGLSTGTHSRTMSVTSPLSSGSEHRGHSHRHSVFGLPHDISHIASFSPAMRSLSPLNPGSLNAVAQAVSFPYRAKSRDETEQRIPLPIDGQSPRLSPFGDRGRWTPPAHSGHHSPATGFPVRTTSISALQCEPVTETPEEEAITHVPVTPDRKNSSPEILEPTPRGHSHNLSDSLEREIREAEAALEQEDAAKGQEESSPMRFAPQNAAQASTFTFKPAPQPAPLPQNASFQFGNPFRMPGNEQPQGFGFQPTSNFPAFPTFQPRAALVPTAPLFEPSKPIGLGLTVPRMESMATSRPTGQAGKLNVTAPSFQPGSVFGNVSSMPSSSFDFTSGHVFRPGASSFEPKKPATPQTEHQSIFGNVEIPETSRPARRSKAVPIVRPSSSHTKDPEEDNDEEGRPMQSVDRQKRAYRQADDEGDSMPLFARRPDSPVRLTITASSDGDSSDAESLPESTVREEVQSRDDNATPTPLEAEHVQKPSDPQDEGSLPSEPRNTSLLSALAEPFSLQSLSHTADQSEHASAHGGAESPAERKISLDSRVPDLSPSRVFSRESAASIIDIEPTPEPEKSPRMLNRNTSPERLTTPQSASHDEMDAVVRQLSRREESLEALEADRSLQTDAMPHRVSSSGTVQIHAISPTISRSPSPLPVDSVRSSPFQEVRIPNNSNLRPSSEWSDDFSSGAASQLNQRSNFFDNRIGEVIAKALETHLRPLHDQLDTVQKAMAEQSQRIIQGRRVPSSSMDSDADDEDDVEESRFLPRPGSSARARKFQLTKAAVLDALSTQRPISPEVPPNAHYANELISINDRIDILLARYVDIGQISAVFEETIHNAQKAMVHSPSPDSSPDNFARENSREEALRYANSELDILRMASAAKDDRLRDLEGRLNDLAAENSAQSQTLDEYRASRTKWKQDQEHAAATEERLRDTVSELEDQLADGLNVRDNMRSRLDRIHSDMATAAEQLANQKVMWEHQNEDLSKQCAVLQARLDHDASLRQRMERELSRLQTLASEGEVTSFQLQQSLATNVTLDETVRSLRSDLTEQRDKNATLQKEVQRERDDNRIELQRARMMMDSAIESAHTHTDAERAGLESKLSVTMMELENLRTLMDAMKVRHDSLLQEESDLRRDTVLKVNEASNAALENLRKRHDEDLQRIEARHNSALDEAQRDKERSELFWDERLRLSEDKNAHLQERIVHVEERLEIAKSAAQAAVSAAQAARATTQSTASMVPERISPQALRESILVLQEQLQERESQIERLQSQVSEANTTLPSKLKEKDIEISWLRELLAVRSEDLNELIDNLSQSRFDQQAARDTAIRIRTALQMEQAEKERHIAAGSSIPAQAMANLTNFASPKAAQLAAAIGNWRARGTPSGPTPSSLRRARQSRGEATPAKRPSSSSSWMSGLMTPPASGPRRTPSPHSPSVMAASKRPDSRDSQTSQATQKLSDITSRILNMPATPDGTPLSLRRGSYDGDAKLSIVGDEELRLVSGGELEPLG